MLLPRHDSIKAGQYHANFDGHRHSDSGNTVVLVCHVILQGILHDQRIMYFYRQGPIKLSYHPVTLGGKRHCCGDIKILVCHVILQIHLIKWSCDFMGRSPSR